MKNLILVLLVGFVSSASFASSLTCTDGRGDLIYHQWTLSTGTAPPVGMQSSLARLFVSGKLVAEKKGFVGQGANGVLDLGFEEGSKEAISEVGKIPGPIYSVYYGNAVIKTKAKTYKARVNCTNRFAGMLP